MTSLQKVCVFVSGDVLGKQRGQGHTFIALPGESPVYTLIRLIQTRVDPLRVPWNTSP